MSDIARLRVVRAGIHSSVSDFTSTPGTLVPLRLTDSGDTLLPRNRTPIARNLLSLSGRRYPHIRGIKDVGDIQINIENCGVNANTGGAVSDWEAKMEAGVLFQSLFGAVAPATTGNAPTINSSGHTPASGILGVDTNPTNTADGNVIAFPTSAGIQIGRIASGGGTSSVTLDHPYSGTPTTGGTITRLAVYTVDDDLTAHRHVFLDAEGENWRRTYAGCAPMSCTFSIPTAERATAAFVFAPTSWTPEDPANPAHAEPTRGEPIVGDRIKIMIDGEEFIATNVSVVVDNAVTIRETTSRENGRLGGVCGTGEGKQIRVEFDIYLGDSGVFAEEIDENGGTVDVRALTGVDDDSGDIAATREIALQAGTEVGSLFYALLPTADVVATPMTSGAFTMVRIVATGTGAVPGYVAFG